MAQFNTKNREVTITNKLGLHARPAAMIAKLIRNANSNVWIVDGDNRADASSVIDILTINGRKGKTLALEVDNEHDIHLLDTLVELFESGFGENTDG